MAEELSTLTMSEIQEMAVVMRNSANNLFRLLGNLLNWARMKQGLIPLNKVVLTLLPIVAESVEMLKESGNKKRIEMDIDISNQLEVFADSNMVQTVIRNLVSNAIKFTPKGGKIKIQAKANVDKSVEVSVTDTGMGMGQAMVDNLFRLDVKTNRVGTEGELSTGLGLLLCKEFVEKHGGRLWVESEEGKGSVFYFTIPSTKKPEEEMIIGNGGKANDADSQIVPHVL
jgi:signal transduction histidine kinase